MQRLDSLDGVRGLLAVYVLLGHMVPFALLPGWLMAAMSHGGAAVDLFFTLSGLVISQSLLRFGGKPTPFLIARAARIFPVFLVVFAVSVALAPLSCGFVLMPWIAAVGPAREICTSTWPAAWPLEIGAHLTMTHGLFPNGMLPDVWVSFLGAAWSLSTEWQFYLLALLVVRWNRGLCWILIGLGCAGAAWQLFSPGPWQFSRAFLPNKGQFFALGVASVAVVQRENGGWHRYWLIFLVAMGICATQGTFGKVLPPVIWTIMLAARASPSMVTSRALEAVLTSAAARYLGSISYCLYLVNEPIHKMAGLALGWLAHGDGRLFTALWLPVAAGAPIALAALLHVYLEAPALRWGRDVARYFCGDASPTIVQGGRRAL